MANEGHILGCVVCVPLHRGRAKRPARTVSRWQILQDMVHALHVDLVTFVYFVRVIGMAFKTAGGTLSWPSRFALCKENILFTAGDGRTHQRSLVSRANVCRIGLVERKPR